MWLIRQGKARQGKVAKQDSRQGFEGRRERRPRVLQGKGLGRAEAVRPVLVLSCLVLFPAGKKKASGPQFGSAAKHTPLILRLFQAAHTPAQLFFLLGPKKRFHFSASHRTSSGTRQHDRRESVHSGLGYNALQLCLRLILLESKPNSLLLLLLLPSPMLSRARLS